MAFKDYLRAVALGGLPEALDTALSGGKQGDTRPEQTAPTGTHRDVEAGTKPPGTGIMAAVAPYVPVLVIGGLVLGGFALMRGRKR